MPLRDLKLVLLIILLGGVAGFYAVDFQSVKAKENAGDLALGLIGTLFIIALFVERAQQVYLVAWRGLGRTKIENELNGLQLDLDEIPEDQKPQRQDFQKKIHDCAGRLAEYRRETQKISLIGGMIIGILIAFIGPRILAEIVQIDGTLTGFQAVLFNFVDILITGGLIGGGSEALHQFVSLITGFMDVTKGKLKQGG